MLDSRDRWYCIFTIITPFPALFSPHYLKLLTCSTVPCYFLLSNLSGFWQNIFFFQSGYLTLNYLKQGCPDWSATNNYPMIVNAIRRSALMLSSWRFTVSCSIQTKNDWYRLCIGWYGLKKICNQNWWWKSRQLLGPEAEFRTKCPHTARFFSFAWVLVFPHQYGTGQQWEVHLYISSQTHIQTYMNNLLTLSYLTKFSTQP